MCQYYSRVVCQWGQDRQLRWLWGPAWHSRGLGVADRVWQPWAVHLGDRVQAQQGPGRRGQQEMPGVQQRWLTVHPTHAGVRGWGGAFSGPPSLAHGELSIWPAQSGQECRAPTPRYEATGLTVHHSEAEHVWCCGAGLWGGGHLRLGTLTQWTRKAGLGCQSPEGACKGSVT